MKMKKKWLPVALFLIVISFAVEIGVMNAAKCEDAFITGPPCESVDSVGNSCSMQTLTGCWVSQALCPGELSVCVVTTATYFDDEHTTGSDQNCDSYRECQEGFCPSDNASLSNGDICVVSRKACSWDPTWNIFNGWDDIVKLSGIWDKSSASCVVCSGVKEDRLLGNSVDTYVESDGTCTEAGNGFFEAACGADAQCDEQVEGFVCAAGRRCDDVGRCVEEEEEEECVPTKTACAANECGAYPNGCPGETIDCGGCGAGEDCTGDPGICTTTDCCSLTGTTDCFNCSAEGRHGVGIETDGDEINCTGHVWYADGNIEEGVACLYIDGVLEDSEVIDNGGSGGACGTANEDLLTGEHDYHCELWEGDTCDEVNLLCATFILGLDIPEEEEEEEDEPDPECIVTEVSEVTCDDEADNDCDGFTDCADLTCVDTPACEADPDDDEDDDDFPPGPDDDPFGGLVPCGRALDDPDTTTRDETDPCTLCHFSLMGQLIIEFLVKIAAVFAVLSLIGGGLVYIVAAGNTSTIEKAKTMIKYALLGFLVVFIAWAVVNSILATMGYTDPIGGEWYMMDC